MYEADSSAVKNNQEEWGLSHRPQQLSYAKRSQLFASPVQLIF